MTTLTAPAPATTADRPRRARATAPIPLARLVKVELRKMFDTRAGAWLMASIVVGALVATAAVIVWAPAEQINYGTFGGAVGMPLAIVLPVIGILAITSEYSQRSALTTFTLVPWRSRVVAAKLLVTVGVGVASMVLALGVAALGHLVGAAIHDVTPVWDQSSTQLSQVLLGQVLGMLVGFTLGVVLRNSPAAIVGYFVYSLVLPGALGMLAYYQEWFRDAWPWVDVQYNITRLFDQTMTTEAWQQLGATTFLWLAVPMALGVRALLRAEVK
jgi:ABC-2 type transport system permease protein